MNDSFARARVWVELLLVLALCYLFFFYGLAAFGLVGADEPRYAQVAREMLQHHTWVTPTLYGNVWLEKPVLYYWGAIVSYKIFGVSDWAARLPGAVFATCMVAWIYVFTRRLRPGSQLDAVVATCSTAFVFAFARAASTDIGLVAWLTIALLSWWGFYESARRGWLLVFYAALGLATLAKGPVAIALAAMVIVVFLFIRRDWPAILRTLWTPGILLCALVTLPWYLAAQHANPGFFREFFLEHNLNRFATNRFQHRQHFWYYIPVLVLATLPWTLFVLAALVRGVRALRASGEDALVGFLSLWVLVPVVFFSVSQSKLPGYILPAIAPCGLLVALYLRQSRAPSPVFTAVHALICGAMLALVMVAPYKLYRMAIPGVVLRLAIPLGLIVALAIAVVVFLRGYGALRIATLLPVAIAVAFLLKAAAPAIDATQSSRPVADRIATSFAAHDPVMFYDVPRGLEYGLAFYLDRPLPEAPPDEIVKFGNAAAGNQPRAKTLKDISNTLPPSHGNYVLVLRTGRIDRFANAVPPNYQIEPFFRFLPQHLDLYYLRDVAPTR